MVSIQIKVPEWLDRIFAWPVMVYRKRKFGSSYRRIDLGEGEWTTLDQQDYYRFGNIKWSLGGKRTTFYATGGIKDKDGQIRKVYLHREVMNAPKGMFVDHRNNDGLDNRRENLRLATRSQNTCNSRIDKSKTTSRFRGVSFNIRRNKWYAVIVINGKHIYLGSFACEIEAAKAYDAAAKIHFGEFARLNFQD